MSTPRATAYPGDQPLLKHSILLFDTNINAASRFLKSINRYLGVPNILAKKFRVPLLFDHVTRLKERIRTVIYTSVVMSSRPKRQCYQSYWCTRGSESKGSQTFEHHQWIIHSFKREECWSYYKCLKPLSRQRHMMSNMLKGKELKRG